RGGADLARPGGLARSPDHRRVRRRRRMGRLLHAFWPEANHQRGEVDGYAGGMNEPLIVGGETHRLGTELCCAEGLEGRRTEWRWLFLDDGSLLEIAPRGTNRYRGHRIFERDHPLFQQLLAQDGVLARFEARVRAVVVGQEPTYVTLERQEYVVRATGTCQVVERI